MPAQDPDAPGKSVPGLTHTDVIKLRLISARVGAYFSLIALLHFCVALLWALCHGAVLTTRLLYCVVLSAVVPPHFACASAPLKCAQHRNRRGHESVGEMVHSNGRIVER